MRKKSVAISAQVFVYTIKPNNELMMAKLLSSVQFIFDDPILMKKYF
jgi:hypothetical protein